LAVPPPEGLNQEHSFSPKPSWYAGLAIAGLALSMEMDLSNLLLT